MLIDVGEVDLAQREIELRCYGAVHVYICRVSGRCSDNWRNKHLVKATEMLEEMGFPWGGSLGDLKTKFVGLRKSDRKKLYFQAVVSPNKANKKKK
jgi:hypothetical protein